MKVVEDTKRQLLQNDLILLHKRMLVYLCNFQQEIEFVQFRPFFLREM